MKLSLKLISFSNSKRFFSSAKEPHILVKKTKGVVCLTYNRPESLNAWSTPLLYELAGHMKEVAKDDDAKVLILTGTGRYYCAGVNFSTLIKISHPQTLWENIRSQNQKLFDMFLDFPKPILVAMNGPAVGASVTSATLCDGIICTPETTLWTPFNQLGITPEGCSSVHFPRIMSQELSRQMLHENKKMTAEEAKTSHIVLDIYPSDTLMDKAHEIAYQWIENKKQRQVTSDLKVVNMMESISLANTILSQAFLINQGNRSWSKKKYIPASVFYTLGYTRILWKYLLTHHQ